MTEKPNEWIQHVFEAADESEIQTIVQGLLEQNANLVAEYQLAQTTGLDYLDRGEPVPANLVRAIKILAGQASGFTGLTIHEYFTFLLKRPRA
jgi:hypothetical protein